MDAGDFYYKHAQFNVHREIINAIWLMESYHQYKMGNLDENAKPIFQNQ